MANSRWSRYEADYSPIQLLLADNVVANPGAGGATFAADDIGGVYYPRTKIVIGADGSNDGDISSANPLPVAVGGPVTVVGTGTFAVQATIAGPATVVGTGTFAVQPSQHTVVGTGTFAAQVTGTVTVVGTGTFAVQPSQHTVVGNGTFSVQASSVAAHTVLGTGTFATQESGAALTALQLLDDVVYVDDADWTDSTSKHMLVGGLYQSTPQTITDGDVGPLQVDENGFLKVAGGAADVNIGGVDGVRVFVFDDAGNQVIDFSGTGGTVATVVGTGTFAVQATSVAQHTVVGTGTFAAQVTGTVTVVGTGTFAVQPAQHTVIGNGTFAVQATTVAQHTVIGNGTFAVQPSAHTVLGSGTFAVQPTPHTTVGLSIFRSIDLDEGALEQVKGSAGALYGGFVTNLATTTRFVKFYNATSGTIGSGTPVMTFAIPGNATDDIGATWNSGGIGIPFSTGICVGASTGVLDNDTGAPGANEVVINLWYA